MFHDYLTCFYVFIISNVDLIFNVTYMVDWFNILFLGYSYVSEVVKMKTMFPEKTHNRDLYLFQCPCMISEVEGILQCERQQFSSSRGCQYL